MSMIDEALGSAAAPGSRLALLTDLYELTMAASYLAEGMAALATFSLFFRRLPPNRSYLVAAGLWDVLDYLESLRFSEGDIEYLRSTRLFADSFLEYLAGLRFRGEVWAMPEGTLFFPNEPVLEVTAPIVEAQLVETYVLNQIHFQAMVAAKASRCIWAARGKPVVDFSLRRTYGAEAGVKVARVSYLAGLQSTSNVLAGKLYGIPIVGTMAHSYVEAFSHEIDSFRAYARSYPGNTVLLIDTYDTLAGARKAAVVAHEMEQGGHRLRGVRLDSGDAMTLSQQVRAILDAKGLDYVKILASGGWDEYSIDQAERQGAPIDIYAVGTKLGVSSDAPYSDMAYKLVAYAGRPAAKLSPGKATLPAAKQVYRRTGADGRLAGDTLALREEALPGQARPLLERVMEKGRICASRPTLQQSRERLRAELDALGESHKRLQNAEVYPVELSPGLRALGQQVADQLQAEEVTGRGVTGG